MEIKKTKGKIDCFECGNEIEGYKISHTYGPTTYLCSECMMTLSNLLTETVSEIRFEKDLPKVK